jgi:hypothetical protein
MMSKAEEQEERGLWLEGRERWKKRHPASYQEVMDKYPEVLSNLTVS